VWLQFRAAYAKTPLTMLAARSGLVMDTGSRVTYKGVEMAGWPAFRRSSVTAAGGQIAMDVIRKYISLIPANVDANIRGTTVFGSKYVSLTSPKHPAPQRITPQQVIDASRDDGGSTRCSTRITLIRRRWIRSS